MKLKDFKFTQHDPLCFGASSLQARPFFLLGHLLIVPEPYKTFLLRVPYYFPIMTGFFIEVLREVGLWGPGWGRLKLCGDSRPGA